MQVPRAHVHVLVLRYQSSQYDALTRNVLLGCTRNRLATSPRNVSLPSARSNASRPCVHTTYNVEPGRYSQRRMRLDRNCLKLNPGMASGTPVVSNGTQRAS